VAGATVHLVTPATWSDGRWHLDRHAQADHLGQYEITGVPQGYPFRIWVSTGTAEGGGDTLVSELYGDVPCPHLACDPNDGTVVQVDPGEHLTGVDFELTGLTTGTYYVTADTREATVNSVGEAYQDVPCPAETCDPTTGTAVAVTTGLTTSGVDLFLSSGGRVSGTVTELGTAEPIPVVTVTVTDGTGHVFGSDITDCSGEYEVKKLPTGSFYVFTTNWRGHPDEVWDDVVCNDDCLAAGGIPVAVTQGVETPNIDFVLDTTLFEDGFESGDTSMWE